MLHLERLFYGLLINLLWAQLIQIPTAQIDNLKVGEPINFKPAPIKDYPDLIGAFTKSGKQIGSVPYDVVNIIRDNYAGYPMSAEVKEVTYYGDHYLCYVTINVYNR